MTGPTDFEEMYRAFEDRFRGSEELIRGRLSLYLPLIELIATNTGEARKALDIGCGRGEWLTLLKENGWHAVGVDSNVSMAEVAHSRGLDVVVADAIAYLADCADASLSLVTAFHVVEHLPLDVLSALLHQIERVLAPGGMVILETPNPENLLVSTWTFHLDPTHEKPVPPLLLQFQVEAAGLFDPVILRLNGSYKTEAGEYSSVPLMAMLSNGPDYAIVATKASADPKSLANAVNAFVAEAGDPPPVDLHAIVTAGAIAAELPARIEALAERQEDLHRNFAEAVDALTNGSNVATARQDVIAAETARLNEKIASIRRRQDEMVAEIAVLREELRRNPSLPRAFTAACSWVFRGVRAWLGFKPGSRPRRIMRRSVFAAQRLAKRHRWLHPIGSRLLALAPRVQRHVFKILSPVDSGAQPTHSVAVFGSTIAMPSDGELLAIERLTHAAETARNPIGAAPGPESAKPRLAYVSPYPPNRSGVADYAAMLLPELSEFYDVDVICAGTDLAVEGGTAGVYDEAWFEQNHGQFDRIIYNMGNSAFHARMPELLRKIPGIVVLHDFYLSDLFHIIAKEEGDSRSFLQALYRSHGFEEASLQVRHPEALATTVATYPASFSVLAEAQGIITHNAVAKTLAAEFYPALDTSDWRTIPLARVVAGMAPRAEARVELGFGPDAFVVCSFGHVQPSKSCDIILNAWQLSAMADDLSCHLVFVGEIPDDEFGRDFRNKLEEAGGNVRTTGYVTESQYASYLASADAGIQLRRKSRGETSAAVLDCLGHGIPTIVNANGSFNELPDEILRKLPDDVTAADIAQALNDFRSYPDKARVLGEAAADYVGIVHSPSLAAESYREAIEHFFTFAPPIANAKSLCELAHDSLRGPVDDDPLPKRIKELSRAAEKVPKRRLFVDVSATARNDLRTGIQRVVRALLLELLRAPPDGYRIEPVLLHDGTGRWLYAHAREYACKTLGLSDLGLADTRVVPRDGDILLVADYFCTGVIDAADQNVYREWRDAGASIQFIVYDMLPVIRPDWFPPWAAPAHEKWARTIAAEGDRLICISHAVADETRRWLAAANAPTIEVHGWALGADMDATSPTRGLPDDAAEILARIQQDQSFLMVGTVEPRKGHLQALEAFERLWEQGSDALLVIVGSEGWKGVAVEFCRNLPHIIDRLNRHPELGRKLIWLKNVSDEFLDQIYASARCLLAASEGEGFGLPLIEAARHGIPILARDIPVFREVGGLHAAYFTATDSSELATAIGGWLARYEAGNRVLPGHMRWLSWSQSAELLKQIVLKEQDDKADRSRALS